MWIVSFFSNNGVPKTGLIPTLTIIDVSDNSIIINAEAMTEMNNGFYKYDFSAYDDMKDYTMISDGTATLPAAERYVTSSNSLFSDINELNRFNKSSMLITGTVLRAYDADGIMQEWDLKDKSGDASDVNIYRRIKK